MDALEQDLAGGPEVPATQVEVGRHRRRRGVRSEGAGGAIHHDLTLVDSSDDDWCWSQRLMVLHSLSKTVWVEPAVLVKPSVTLSNRFGVLEDVRGAEVHVLSDDGAASTMSDTRVRRWLSLVWEADRPQLPAEGAHPESVVREEEDSVESERGIPEPDEERRRWLSRQQHQWSWMSEHAMSPLAWQVWTNSMCLRFSSQRRGRSCLRRSPVCKSQQ